MNATSPSPRIRTHGSLLTRRTMKNHLFHVVCLLVILDAVSTSHILMITLGGTHSHKVPFLALGHGLVSRGHNVTLLSAFPPGPLSPSHPSGTVVKEVTPAALVEAVEAFSHIDVLGRKLNGDSAYSVVDILSYAYKTCEAFFSSPQTRALLSSVPDLLILDGAFPECLLALAVHFHRPFVLLNTVAFHTLQLSSAGNPSLPSVTPFLDSPFSDRMDLWERTINGAYHAAAHILAVVMNKVFVEPVVRSNLGAHIPANSIIARNVSLILQNGHHSVTYPRPFLPVVIEVACMHCTPPKPLPQDFEAFVRAGAGRGFVYVSFGTSLRSTQLPGELRRLLVTVLGSLPYQVLWKYEAGNGSALGLPSNVRTGSWFPQQDLLGHPLIVGFVNHGGLHGVLEAVYHGVPMVLLPIFCDHAANSRKARGDGYAEVLEWRGLTAERLRAAVVRVTGDNRYRDHVRQRSLLLRDQPEPPLARALYWVEYVLRHGGAPHLRSPAADLTTAQYYMLDSLALLCVAFFLTVKTVRTVVTIVMGKRKSAKFKLN